MGNQAKVSSTDALDSFRVSLILFRGKARKSVDEVTDKCGKALREVYEGSILTNVRNGAKVTARYRRYRTRSKESEAAWSSFGH